MCNLTLLKCIISFVIYVEIRMGIDFFNRKKLLIILYWSPYRARRSTNTVSTSQQSPLQQQCRCAYSKSVGGGDNVFKLCITSKAEIKLLVSWKYLLRCYEAVTLQRPAWRLLLHKIQPPVTLHSHKQCQSLIRDIKFMSLSLSTHLLKIVLPHQQPKLSHDSHFFSSSSVLSAPWGGRGRKTEQVSGHFKRCTYLFKWCFG